VGASCHSWLAAASVAHVPFQGIEVLADVLVAYLAGRDIEAVGVQGPYRCFLALEVFADQGAYQDAHQTFEVFADPVPYQGVLEIVGGRLDLGAYLDVLAFGVFVPVILDMEEVNGASVAVVADVVEPWDVLAVGVSSLRDLDVSAAAVVAAAVAS